MKKYWSCSSISAKLGVLIISVLGGSIYSGHGGWTIDGGATVQDPEDGINSSGQNDFFVWGATFGGGGSLSVNGSTATWSATATAEGVAAGPHPGVNQEEVHGGVTSTAQGQVYGEVWAHWTPDSEHIYPPDNFKITVSVDVTGNLEAKGRLWWVTDPTGDLIWGIAGAGASASADPGVPNAPGGGVASQGGLTNGLPNAGTGGGAQSSGSASITSNDLDSGTSGDENSQTQIWDNRISFTISYTGDYDVPNTGGEDSWMVASPSLNVFASGDVNLETLATNWERVQVEGHGNASVGGAISYALADYPE